MVVVSNPKWAKSAAKFNENLSSCATEFLRNHTVITNSHALRIYTLIHSKINLVTTDSWSSRQSQRSMQVYWIDDGWISTNTLILIFTGDGSLVSLWRQRKVLTQRIPGLPKVKLNWPLASKRSACFLHSGALITKSIKIYVILCGQIFLLKMIYPSRFHLRDWFIWNWISAFN